MLSHVLVTDVTDAVVGAMQELRVATVARNLEVQEEVDVVRNRRIAASAFLDAEIHERDTQLENMKVGSTVCTVCRDTDPA